MMVFGITKDDSIIHKELGQGYISINMSFDGYEFHKDSSWGQGRRVVVILRSSELASVQLQKQQCR